MRFLEILNEKEILKALEPNRFGDINYSMNIKDDKFVHFTTEERANLILKDNMLKMKPPYKKFGIDAITAVSLTYGELVPGVQLTHIKDEDKVAIIFKTDILPKYGVVEEVIWSNDVIFSSVSKTNLDNAISLIKNSPFNISDNSEVYYYH